MSRSRRIRARTGTRATARKLPTSSKTWTPSFGSFSLAPRTRARRLYWRRRNRSATELKIPLQTHKLLYHRLRLATEARAKASKALEVAKREEADIVELSAVKRAEVDQLKATLLQHNNDVELLELRYRTEAGNAELCHFESPGVQTVAAPLSRVRWAAGFRNCLNAEARDLFDAFCKELEQNPDSEGLGAAAETPVIPPAPETPLGQAGDFAPFPKPRSARVGPYLAPPPRRVCPGDGPALMLAGTSVLVHTPTCPQFAMISDSCPRSVAPPFSRDTEGALLGLPVPSCSMDPLNSTSGAQAASPSAQTFSQPSRSRVPEQCGARLRLFATTSVWATTRLACFAGISLRVCWMEVRTWGYADDEEDFTNILIFADSSGTMTDSCPPPQPRCWMGNCCPGTFGLRTAATQWRVIR